jgi:hypothetical protein
MPHQ